MRAFFAFFKKELLELTRSGKLLLLFIVFCAIGIMNPAVAKLTPWLLEVMGEELAESGMVVTGVSVDALTSWTQFFKNIPLALIAFVLVMGGSFTREYESGTLILIFTKGFARYKALLAKAATTLLLWSGLYWLCFGITYGYNAYYWDNGIAESIGTAATYWWLFGVLTVALTVFFSVLARGFGAVLLGTGGCILAFYLISIFPKTAKYLPTSLMNGMVWLTGAEKVSDYLPAAIITASLSVALIAVSVPMFNKKQL